MTAKTIVEVSETELYELAKNIQGYDGILVSPMDPRELMDVMLRESGMDLDYLCVDGGSVVYEGDELFLKAPVTRHQQRFHRFRDLEINPSYTGSFSVTGEYSYSYEWEGNYSSWRTTTVVVTYRFITDHTGVTRIRRLSETER